MKEASVSRVIWNPVHDLADEKIRLTEAARSVFSAGWLLLRFAMN
jgi:hypothetical protein